MITSKFSLSLGIVVLLSLFENYSVVAPAVGPGTAPISISVVPSVANPAPGGENYQLTCNFSGISASHCKWKKNNSIIEGETRRTLSFSPLKLSDAGNYKCGCTDQVNETSLTFESFAIDVTIQIPSPTSVLIRSDPANPIGTDVTLTCSVELNEAVDIPVTVNTYFLGPDVFSVSNSSIVEPVTGSTNTYTTTATISSFGIDNAGVYWCAAGINSTKFNGDQLMASRIIWDQVQITAGEFLSLRGNAIPNNSHVSITDIGERRNGAALLCVTNISQCCDRRAWLFPNGSEISINGSRIYLGRDSTSILSLNRRSNAMAPSGLYCCKVTKTSGTITRICANIVSAPTVAPINFAVEDLPTSRKVQFSWDSPSTESEYITTYTLNCTTKAQGGNPVIVAYNEAGSYSLGGFRPATEYNCSVSASNSAGHGPSVSITVTTLDEFSLFQLRLTGVDNCRQWVAEDTGIKLESIKAAVVDSTRELCQSCGVTGDRITNEVFQCFPASPEAVTYRANLHGTASANSTQLLSHIEQWTAQGAAINIQQVLLRVDGSCRVAVFALVDDECIKRNVKSDSSSGNTNITIISVGGVLAAVIIVVVIIVIVIVTVAVCIRRNKHQERGRVDQMNPVVPVEVSVMGHQDPTYELPMDSLDHDYERLDIYTDAEQQKKAIQPPITRSGQQPPNSNGYKLTQCPAYGAIAHK